MTLSSVVETIDILNVDNGLSNPSSNAQILGSETELDRSHYIISNADQELLILIKFKQIVNLDSIGERDKGGILRYGH